MPTCYAYSCSSYCDNHWAGCRNYGCVDFAPLPVTHSISDTDGVCVHNVTTICTTVSAWSRWIEVAGVSDGSYYSSRTVSASRAYLEATPGEEADTGEPELTRHIEDLRYAINEERARRISAGTSIAGSTPVVWGSLDDIDSATINELVTAVNQIAANTITDVNPITDQTSISYHIDKIRKQIEGLRKNCISNKVCSPNTTCSCYCHCNCHYSDARLKRDIRSL